MKAQDDWQLLLSVSWQTPAAKGHVWITLRKELAQLLKLFQVAKGQAWMKLVHSWESVHHLRVRRSRFACVAILAALAENGCAVWMSDNLPLVRVTYTYYKQVAHHANDAKTCSQSSLWSSLKSRQWQTLLLKLYTCIHCVTWLKNSSVLFVQAHTIITLWWLWSSFYGQSGCYCKNHLTIGQMIGNLRIHVINWGAVQMSRHAIVVSGGN